MKASGRWQRRAAVGVAAAAAVSVCQSGTSEAVTVPPLGSGCQLYSFLDQVRFEYQTSNGNVQSAGDWAGFWWNYFNHDAPDITKAGGGDIKVKAFYHAGVSTSAKVGVAGSWQQDPRCGAAAWKDMPVIWANTYYFDAGGGISVERMAHEWGHVFGLGHTSGASSSCGNTALMHPTSTHVWSCQIVGPTGWDVATINQIYKP